MKNEQNKKTKIYIHDIMLFAKVTEVILLD